GGDGPHGRPQRPLPRCDPPSPPLPGYLARAAAVCRHWRRVASSPALLRLFRRLHPPPLLGFFICNDGFIVEKVNGVLIGEILSPTFFTSNPEPPGLSGVVSRCINFSLDSLPDVERWALADTRDGILLFCASFSAHDRLQIPSHFVVCDPVTGRSVLIGDAPLHESAYLGASLLLTDGRLSFEVIVVTYFMWGPRLLVFSSHSGGWTVHPYADVGGRSIMTMLGSVGYDMHANGCVYWVINDEEHEASEYLMALDTRLDSIHAGVKLTRLDARWFDAKIVALSVTWVLTWQGAWRQRQ
uniref:F-box domain-containing protein n=1 Tax=Setaria italica TaxID=4555 RepID=K3YMM5_SETIT